MKQENRLEELIRNPKEGQSVSIVHMQMVKEDDFIYCAGAFTCPEDVAEMVAPYFQKSDREMTAVISLNGHGAPIAFEIIAVGTVNRCILSPRDIFKHALLCNAVNVIIAHNHPSGVCIPSSEDIAVTQRIKEAGQLIGIELLDHIIVGDGKNYMSLEENGYLKEED